MHIENSNKTAATSFTSTPATDSNNSTNLKVGTQKDLVSITAETKAFTEAVAKVRRGVTHIYPHGYKLPPEFLSNEKQLQILRESIAEQLTNPNEEQVAQAAQSIWEGNYRLDSAPAPDPYRGSGLIFDYLTREDRKDIDIIYDEAKEQGLDTYEIPARIARGLSDKRCTDAQIRRGTTHSYGQGILPSDSNEKYPLLITVENLDSAIANKYGETPNSSTDSEDPRVAFSKEIQSMLDTEVKTVQTILQSLMDNLTGSPETKRRKQAQFNKIFQFIGSVTEPKAPQQTPTVEVSLNRESSETEPPKTDSEESKPTELPRLARIPTKEELAKEWEEGENGERASFLKANNHKYKGRGQVQIEDAFDAMSKNLTGTEEEQDKMYELFRDISDELLEGAPRKIEGLITGKRKGMKSFSGADLSGTATYI